MMGPPTWGEERSHETARLCSDIRRPGASRLQWGPSWARDAEPDSHASSDSHNRNSHAVACSPGRMPKANSMSGAYGLPASAHLSPTRHVPDLPRSDHVSNLPKLSDLSRACGVSHLPRTRHLR